VSVVEVGAGAYGLLLTKQGKIATDLFLVDDGDTLFVGVAPGRGDAVRELLDRYLVMEDAELGVPSAALSWHFVTAGDAPAAALTHGKLRLSELQALVAVVPEEPTPASAQSAEQLAALWARHGLGVFGVDFGERDNPHEASLDRIAISWTKGCYLGQEVVCMQDMRGKVKRRLVALESSVTSPVAELVGQEVRETGASAAAGHVSSAHASAPGQALLLASVASPALDSHADLSVNGERVRVVERAVSLEGSPG